MIIVTGAAWFIGSTLVSTLLSSWQTMIAVDDFTKSNKEKNRKRMSLVTPVSRDNLWEWLTKNSSHITCIVHLGARTDTTEFDEDIFDNLNLWYSKKLWHWCTTHAIPFIYASSAATYGWEESNFDDDEVDIPNLKPLNPYWRSKQLFDIWALGQQRKPPYWIWLKFFNVYWPNEYHKWRMASVVLHAYRSISTTGKMSLFRSHREDFADGMQSRDFIYVKDLLHVIEFFIKNITNTALNWIYNLWTGKARSFYDLANTVFSALYLKPSISYIDTPSDIRANYQYFTEAKMDKLYNAWYHFPFMSLEEGVTEYVKEYLVTQTYL